jgi:hypothetical protein
MQHGKPKANNRRPKKDAKTTKGAKKQLVIDLKSEVVLSELKRRQEEPTPSDIRIIGRAPLPQYLETCCEIGHRLNDLFESLTDEEQLRRTVESLLYDIDAYATDAEYRLT